MAQTEGLKASLRAAWVRKLYMWWGYYNEEYLAEALQRPVIRLGGSERALGTWDGTRRTLTIAETHVARDPWPVVMETLRHEMAHQYVADVLRAEDESPHAAAFQEACQRLRCRPTARATASGLPEEDRILRVLKKVLSLAESPNAHEAEAAVQKARQLLMKYNIDLVELDRKRQFGTRCLGAVKGRRTSAELWLAALLNRFFFVEVLWVQGYDAQHDRLGTVLQIYGTSQNLDMAEYVYAYLLHLLDGLWASYRVENEIPSNRERQRYFAGVLEGFYQKLGAQEQALAQTRALVWKGDARLKAYYQYLNPRVRTRYGGGVMQTPVYRDGIAEGHRVTIHRPVEETGAGTSGYLDA